MKRLKRTSEAILLSHRSQLLGRRGTVLGQIEHAEQNLGVLHRDRTTIEDQLADVEHDLRRAGVEFDERPVTRYDHFLLHGAMSSTVTAERRHDG